MMTMSGDPPKANGVISGDPPKANGMSDKLPKAMGSALNALAYRPRSEAELRARLLRKFAPETADRAIARLKEQGLVDDAKFAELWASYRVRHSPRGARAILAELAQKGVPRGLAEAAVEILDDDDSASRAAVKFARRLSGDGFEKFHRRMRDHLLRRGFARPAARRAAFQAWDERG